MAGILLYDPWGVPSGEGLRRMAAVLRHRGPDDEGIVVDGPAGLAHRRLAIIDLMTGQQPMSTPDRRMWIVFNGEIYNFLELRAELEALGHVFHTRSDTEVLLALYREYGVAAFPKLNGMFACAFWDGHTKELVLVRDRWGKKPLVFAHDARRILFGSEVKALLAYGDLARRVHPGALHEYLTRGYLAGAQSILEGIEHLPPGHFLVARGGARPTVKAYSELRFQPVRGPISEPEFLAVLHEKLRSAVNRRLMSDVPLGAFLSGGLDSSLVVALMARLSNRPVKTFSIGFEESDFSEMADARIVARHLQTDHTEIIVRPSAFELLPDLVWYLDEPLGDSSAIPSYYVSRAARQHVTVALSGDGGDEVFAGYTRYRLVRDQACLRQIPRWLGRGVAGGLTSILPFTTPGWNSLAMIAQLSGRRSPSGLGIYPFIHNILYTPELREATAEHDPLRREEAILESVRSLDTVSQVQFLDMHQYLPGDILTKVDRMSMAVSLEVRAPLLDHDVVEFMARAPMSLKLRGDISKYALRRLAARLLPPSTIAKGKHGFAIPQGRWFQSELHTQARDLLLDRRTLSRGYFEPRVLRRLIEEQRRGHRDYSTWLWNLMVLELWHRLFLDPDTRRV